MSGARNDEDLLRGFTEMRLICAFNLPVTGREHHDADGAYAQHPKGAQWAALRNGAWHCHCEER